MTAFEYNKLPGSIVEMTIPKSFSFLVCLYGGRYAHVCKMQDVLLVNTTGGALANAVAMRKGGNIIEFATENSSGKVM